MMTESDNRESPTAVKDEFNRLCDEYIMCHTYAAFGLKTEGEKIKQRVISDEQNMWLASNLSSQPKYHARMNMPEFCEKSKLDGYFSSEIAKALICLVYSLWDETYRHRLASALGIKAENIIAPLMGDLRKIRHCIIHNKSEIPTPGMKFEVLTWRLIPGTLHITRNMLYDLNDNIREMRIQARSMSPEMQAVYEKMTPEEKKDFEKWTKQPGSKAEDARWPGLKPILARIKAASDSSAS
ncbi:hypothetical protein FEE59_24475 [Herbaspirillum sp. RU 5E]|nr:hypothetical protein [Herbaspirillum sp. RU 5E]